MARPGPRPEPAPLKMLRGERRPSRLGHEPPGRGGDPQPPAGYDDQQRHAFAELLALTPPGVLTLSDSIAVEAATDALLRYRRSAELAQVTGPLLKSSRPGAPEVVVSPAWRSARLDSMVLLRWVAELGLSPAARASLRFGFQPPVDPREALLSAPIY